MKREKNYSIEILRVISCIFVIFIHTSNMYSRAYGDISNSSYVFSLFINSIARIAVPIFFMVSGALLINEPVDVKKNTKRIFRNSIVLVVWSGIYIVWNKVYLGKEYDFTTIFKTPVKKHLWFMFAIIGIYISLPFIQCMAKVMSKELQKYFVGLWFGLLAVSFTLSIYDMGITYKIPILGATSYLGYFMIGYIFAKNIKHIHIRTRYLGLIFLACNITNIVLTYKGALDTGKHIETFFMYRNALVAISAAVTFIAVYKMQDLVIPEMIKKIMNKISANSLDIYLIHVIFLDIVKFEFQPFSIHSAIGIIIYSAFIFVASYICAEVMRSLRKRKESINEHIKCRTFNPWFWRQSHI